MRCGGAGPGGRRGSCGAVVRWLGRPGRGRARAVRWCGAGGVGGVRAVRSCGGSRGLAPAVLVRCGSCGAGVFVRCGGAVGLGGGGGSCGAVVLFFLSFSCGAPHERTRKRGHSRPTSRDRRSGLSTVGWDGLGLGSSRKFRSLLGEQRKQRKRVPYYIKEYADAAGPHAAVPALRPLTCRGGLPQDARSPAR